MSHNYEIIIVNYLEMDIKDIDNDLKKYSLSEVEELQRRLMVDVLGGNRHSPDWWLYKLLDKEIKSRK